MSRRSRLASFYALSLLMSACAQAQLLAPAVTSSATPSASPAGPSPSPSTAAPSVAPSSVPTTPATTGATPLTGTVSLASGSVAGLTVSAFQGDGTTPVATTTTNADGSYSLAMPAGSQGQLVRVVATGGGKTLVGAGVVAQSAGAYRLEAAQGTELSESSTLAALALSHYLFAASSLKLAAADLQAVQQAYQDALTTARQAVAQLGADQVNQLLATADAHGNGSVNASLAARVTASGGFGSAYIADAKRIADVINHAVAGGQHLPSGSVPGGTISFGSATAPAIQGSTSSGGSGGGGSSGPAATPVPTPTPVPPATVLTSFVVPDIGDQTGFGVAPGGASVWVSTLAGSTERLLELSSAGAMLTSSDAGYAGGAPHFDLSHAPAQVWFTKYNSLQLLAGGTLTSTVYQVPNGTSPAVLADGSVWALNNSYNLVHLDSAGGLIAALASGGPTLATTGDGGVWVQQYDGDVLRVEPNGTDFASTQSFWAGAAPNTIAGAADGSLWVGTSNGVVGHLSTTGVDLGSVQLGSGVLGLGPVSDGSVWAVQSGGFNNSDTLWHLTSAGAVLSSAALPSLYQSATKVYAEAPGRGVWVVALNASYHPWAYHVANDGTLASFALASITSAAFDPADGSLWAIDDTPAIYHLAS